MAYHIYQTTALVLGRTPVGESNAYISLLTKELGLIRAVARNVRSEKSKLRYALQKYMESEVSLVRGKDVWRITGAVPIDAHTQVLSGFLTRRALASRISRLTLRLHGEEHNPYAFESVRSFFGALGSAGVNEDDLELVTVLRLLYALGYVGNDASLEGYITNSELHPALFVGIETDRDLMVSVVNQALVASTA
jgi:DNA repair protein RecO (recombination protein O)